MHAIYVSKITLKTKTNFKDHTNSHGCMANWAKQVCWIPDDCQQPGMWLYINQALKVAMCKLRGVNNKRCNMWRIT